MNVGPVERLGLTRKVRPLPTRLEACMHVRSFVRNVEAFWRQPSSCNSFWGSGFLGLCGGLLLLMRTPWLRCNRKLACPAFPSTLR